MPHILKELLNISMVYVTRDSLSVTSEITDVKTSVPSYAIGLIIHKTSKISVKQIQTR